jgi:mRNA deadenylase 3'-5' endonuclease subunit Ccr4
VDVISQSNADFVCLQEIDGYKTFYAAELTRIGFEHRYLKFDCTEPEMGVVLAWNPENWNIQNSEDIYLSKIKQATEDEYFKRHNTAIIGEF